MENVAIFDSPGKGRGLKATKEFWAGDVIFSEPSLAAVVFDRYSTVMVDILNEDAQMLAEFVVFKYSHILREYHQFTFP